MLSFSRDRLKEHFLRSSYKVANLLACGHDFMLATKSAMLATSNSKQVASLLHKVDRVFGALGEVACRAKQLHVVIGVQAAF